jgi:transketolase
MRNTFAYELTTLAAADPRLVVLSGDIGNRLFDDYKRVASGRFYNCGVAEANMTGVAAGLALIGFRPVTYTITPFAVVRCLEQIRVDVCYHGLPVIIAGTGSGLSYAELGPTHHSLDDVAFMRALPGMTVVCPCDQAEVRLALRAALQQNGPVYLRLGKKGEPALHKAVPEFHLGRAITLRQGTDTCILSSGPITGVALSCADLLAERGISVRVESVHTIKPLDTVLLEELSVRYKVIAVLEEHGLIGGLGSAVAEWLADHHNNKIRLLRFGTPDRFMETIGSQEYARALFGLTPEHLATALGAAVENV